MNEQILQHVETLFRDAPRKRHVSDIREELLSNMNEKYNDLIAQGRTPDEAFGVVAAGVGDIQSLIAEVGEGDFGGVREGRRKALQFYAAGGGLVVAGVLLFFLLMGLRVNNIPVTIVSAVTLSLGLASFIYGSGLKWPEPYQKEDDSFVEEYKQKHTTPSRNTRLRGAASSMLWISVVMLYFLISFLSNSWATTWVIFLVGAVLQQVVNSVFTDQKRVMTTGMVMTTAAILYLILSFGTGYWHLTWLIFLAAVAVDQGIRFMRIWGEKDPS